MTQSETLRVNTTDFPNSAKTCPTLHTYIHIPLCHHLQAGTSAIMKTGKTRREKSTSEKQNREKALQVSSGFSLAKSQYWGRLPPITQS